MSQSTGRSTGSESSTPDFGANEWLVEEMKERFDADPDSVDPAWATYFGGRTAGSDDNGQKAESASTATADPPAKDEPATKEPAAKKA